MGSAYSVLMYHSAGPERVFPFSAVFSGLPGSWVSITPAKTRAHPKSFLPDRACPRSTHQNSTENTDSSEHISEATVGFMSFWAII